MPTQVINTCDHCKAVIPEGQQPIRIVARVLLPKGRMPGDTTAQQIADKKACAQALLAELGNAIPDPA